MTEIINARYDDSAGEHAATERWHIPREFDPSKSLCEARLSGPFKRSKGSPTCGTCRSRQSFGHIDHRKLETLVAVSKGLVIPREGIGYYDALFEYDLLGWKPYADKYVLTSRGELLVEDFLNPVSVIMTTKLCHGRPWMSAHTYCGIRVIDEDRYLEELRQLHEAAARGLLSRMVTCMDCITVELRRRAEDYAVP